MVILEDLPLLTRLMHPDKTIKSPADDFQQSNCMTGCSLQQLRLSRCVLVKNGWTFMAAYSINLWVTFVPLIVSFRKSPRSLSRRLLSWSLHFFYGLVISVTDRIRIGLFRSQPHAFFPSVNSWETQKICGQNNRGISTDSDLPPSQQTILKPWLCRCHFITILPPEKKNKKPKPGSPLKSYDEKNNKIVHARQIKHFPLRVMWTNFSSPVTPTQQSFT